MNDSAAATLAQKLSDAEAVLEHRFADRALLAAALTHPSAVEGSEASSVYERLEFLGDSIVGFVVAAEVFRRFPDMTEGGMTRVKVSVVNGQTMTRVAHELGLERVLVLGQSEQGTNHRGLASVLENTYESLTAALFLDAGIDVARQWVMRTLGPSINEEVAAVPENPKSLLQEVVQAKGTAPVYRVVAQSGPPHDRKFTSTVSVNGEIVGEGSGRSKKESESAAAFEALKHLSE